MIGFRLSPLAPFANGISALSAVDRRGLVAISFFLGVVAMPFVFNYGIIALFDIVVVLFLMVFPSLMVVGADNKSRLHTAAYWTFLSVVAVAFFFFQLGRYMGLLPIPPILLFA